MNQLFPRLLLVIPGCMVFISACDKPATSLAPNNLTTPSSPWLGIPSAVNQVIVFLHDGTGWLLNKSQVSVKKSGDVRTTSSDSTELICDFQIAVQYGGESFETTATDIPCDKDGIPTEAAVDRLRSATSGRRGYQSQDETVSKINPVAFSSRMVVPDRVCFSTAISR